MTGPWDIPPERKARFGARHVGLVITGIAVGGTIGLLLPQAAPRYPGAAIVQPGQNPPTLNSVEPRKRREDTPLAPAWTDDGTIPRERPAAGADSTTVHARFGLCGSGGGSSCVVDGDTFRHRGEKIRIADIDTPELNPARCAEEERLGKAAKARLRDLLNEGPFRLEPIPGRDRDSYGRQLRVVVRDGRSLGDQLVAEGLARTWTGRREPWC